MADEDSGRDEEIEQLRRTLALARFWLERFGDPDSFVWRATDQSPHDFARSALREIDDETPPDRAQSTGELAIGTGRMPRLTVDRAGFVEFHQVLARQALEIGAVRAARAALRVLRAADFGPMSHIADQLLAILRDSRATDDEVADAALRLTRLVPAPPIDSPG
jgi:hypothetical protein